MLGSFTERLALLITADTAGAVKEIKKLGETADKELSRAQSRQDKWSAGLTKGGAAAVGFAAVTGTALFKFAQASEEARASELRLENTLANMPKLADANKDAFIDLADAIQDKTAADGDQIVAAEAMLGTFRLTQDEILKATPLVVDYARKFNVDLTNAAIQVGKAFDGQIGALKRNGVSIDENLYKTDRFAAVTQALREQVGGFAEAEGATFSGRLQRLKNELGDVAEGVGVGVVDAMTDVLGPLTAVSDKFTDLDPATQALIGRVGTLATGAIGAAGSVSFLAGQALKLEQRFAKDPTVGWSSGLNKWGKVAGVAAGAATALGIAYVALSSQADRAQEAQDELTAAVRDGGKTLGEASGTQIANYLADNKELREVMDEAGISVTGLNRAVQDGGPIYDEIREKLADMMANRELKDGASQLRDKVTALREAFVNTKDSIDAGNQATKELAGETLDATTAVDDLGTETDETKQSTLDYTEAIKAADQAQRDHTNAIYGARDAARDFREAQFELTDKIAAFDAAIRNGATPGTRDYIEAQDDAEAAIDDAAEAAGRAADEGFFKLYGRHLNNAESADVQREALEKIRDGIAPGSPLLTYLDALIAELDEAARPRTGNLTFHIGGGQFNRPIEEDGTGHADGSPLTEGFNIINEEGPELLYKRGASVEVMTAGQTKRAFARGAGNGSARGGNNYTINVNVAPGGHPAETGRQIIDLIRAYENGNGSSWRP